MYRKKNPSIYRNAFKAVGIAYDADTMVSEEDQAFGKRVLAALEKSGEFSTDELSSLAEMLGDSSLLTASDVKSKVWPKTAADAAPKSSVADFDKRFGTERLSKASNGHYEFPDADRLR